MRITKVKIKSSKIAVELLRQKNYGYLKSDIDYKNDKIRELLDKKTEFIKSFSNKPVAKFDKAGKLKNSADNLSSLLNNILSNETEKLNKSVERFFTSLSKIDEKLNISSELNRKELLKKIINPKFLKVNDDNFKIIDLISSIYEVDNTSEIIKKLAKFTEWAKSTIEKKKTRLAKSIENNKINYTENLSRRKIFLEKIAKILVDNDSASTFDNFILSIADKYKVDDVIKYINVVKLEYLSNLAEEKVAAEPSKKIKDTFFDFKVKVKDILNDHQYQCVFKLHNQDVLQYNDEVKKYFDLYFPVKKSGKNNPNNLREEYLEFYLNVDKIKGTIKNRIFNATIQFLLLKGKYIKYGLGDNISSDELRKIKCKEAFHLQFLNAIGFAINNICNIINYNGSSDILGKKNFSVGLQQNLTNTNINYFFSELKPLKNNLHNPEKLSEYIDIMSAIRGSVQAIRNSIVHFDKKAHDVILNNKCYEFYVLVGEDIQSESCKYYSANPLKKTLSSELDILPKYYAEKLKSGRIFEFYNIEDLKNIDFNIELKSKPLPFIPSFKNVFSLGRKYQEAQKSLSLDSYVIEEKDGEATKVFRFALKQIYENIFIKQFLEDVDNFQLIIDEVINSNKQENNNDVYKYAFKEVDKKLFGRTPKEYLSYIQSEIIKEELIKREKDMSETKTGYFQKFLWTLFLKGFDSFLKKNKNLYAFFKKPKYIDGVDVNNVSNSFSQYIKISKSIDITDSVVSFWIFCKLLDANHLNELDNQISKYISYIEEKDNINYLRMQEIIKIALLTIDTSFDNELVLDDIKVYTDFENKIKPADIYYERYLQSDKKTVIPFSGVVATKKYATNAIIKSVISSSFKITQNDIDELEKMKTQIANKQEDRLNLHKEWVENKKIDENKRNEYKDLVEFIEKYNWLDNKVNLVHVKKLHNILFEVLGRLIGFVSIFDRDFQFLDISSSSYRIDDNYYFNEFVNFRCLIDHKSKSEINKVFDVKNGKCLSHFPTDVNQSKIFDDCLKKKKVFYSNYFYKDDKEVPGYRNYIAHFNYISNNSDKSILGILSDVRKVISYDRKLKNAVLKSFVDIFDRHGICLDLKLDHTSGVEKLHIASIKPKAIKHLRDKVIIVPDSSFCSMIKVLLEYKSQPS